MRAATVPALPKAYVFETGTNIWRQYPAWPPPDTAEKTLYKWTMHSVDGKPVAASNGILAVVNGDLDQIGEHDTVIVCGGLSIQHHADKRLIAWLRKAARTPKALPYFRPSFPTPRISRP